MGTSEIQDHYRLNEFYFASAHCRLSCKMYWIVNSRPAFFHYVGLNEIPNFELHKGVARIKNIPFNIKKVFFQISRPELRTEEFENKIIVDGNFSWTKTQATNLVFLGGIPAWFGSRQRRLNFSLAFLSIKNFLL